MKTLRLVLAAFAVTALPLAAQTADSWDGLTKVRSSRADAVYLLPGVDFRTYTKVMLDPAEVAFRRNFQRDYNMSARMGGRLSDEEISEITALARSGFQEVFADAYRRAGYQVVDAPGADVLRLRTGVLNLYIAAPDQMSSGRTRTVSAEAGQATLVLEVRDSLAGTILGRAVDTRTAGDSPGIRDSVSNRQDFEQLFREWARISVRGLEELKAQSPIDPATLRQRR